MNFFSFSDTNPIALLVSTILAITCVSLLCNLGYLIAPRCNNKSLQCVLGIGLSGCLITFAISFCAALCKWIIIVSLLISFIVFLVRLRKKAISIKASALFIAKISAVCLLFVLLLFAYIYIKGETVDYNCHQIYAASISEEIFKADYYSRLRIIDVYSEEWSKFHFFNGATSSIALIAFRVKNYLSFFLAKSVIISVFIVAIFDALSTKYSRKKAFLKILFTTITLIVFSEKLLRWSIFLNNYSSLLLMALLWILLSFQKPKLGLPVASIVALATSKTTLLGLALELYELIKLYKKNNSIRKLIINNWRLLAFTFMLNLGAVSMLLTGGSPGGESLLNPNFWQNITNIGWLSFIPLAESTYELVFHKSFSLILQILAASAVFVFLFAKKRKIVLKVIKSNAFALICACILLGSIYLSYWIKINNGVNLIRLGILQIPIWLLLVFVIPILYLMLHSKPLRYPLILFSVVSLAQFIILNADNAACNFSTLAPLFCYYFATDIFSLGRKKSSRAVVLTIFFGLFLATCYTNRSYFFYAIYGSDEDPHHLLVKLSPTDDLDNTPFEYFDSSQSNEVILNSLRGNRIHYNKPTDAYDEEFSNLSMSMRFVVK